MIYFPNTQRVVDSCIIKYGGIFYSVIVDDAITVLEPLPIKYRLLFSSQVDESP